MLIDSSRRHSADTHLPSCPGQPGTRCLWLNLLFSPSAEGSLEPQIEDLINRIHELQQGKLQDLRRPAGREGHGLGNPRINTCKIQAPLDCLKVGLQHPSLQDTARLEATSHCRPSFLAQRRRNPARNWEKPKLFGRPRVDLISCKWDQQQKGAGEPVASADQVSAQAVPSTFDAFVPHNPHHLALF